MVRGAWHEGHIMGGFLHPKCASCRGEERRSRKPPDHPHALANCNEPGCNMPHWWWRDDHPRRTVGGTMTTETSALPCETDIWTRLEVLAMSEGGSFTIYPAFALRDGGWGDWTIRYERSDPIRGRRARYLRTFGEGPTRIAALMDLASQLLPIEEPDHA